MLASFINSIIKTDLDLDRLINLLPECRINLAVKNNKDLRELIDIKENKLKMKSSLLANYIINECGLKKDAIKVLIEMAEQADIYKHGEKYNNFLRTIISFSTIQFLLKTKDDDKYKNNIVTYYDKIKNLEFNKGNPYFWFQYAIARLDLKEYSKAKKHFDNAYGYAKKNPNFDTLQLDTHYARYLLENQIENGNLKNAFEIFSEAHSYITKDRKNKTHYHYPLRQTIHYYRKFYDEFLEIEKIKFRLKCNEILQKIDSYKSSLGEKRSAHSDVIRSEKNLRKILANLFVENADKNNIGYIKKKGLHQTYGFIKTKEKDVHFKKGECNFYPSPFDVVEFKLQDNNRGGTAKKIKKIPHDENIKRIKYSLN